MPAGGTMKSRGLSAGLFLGALIGLAVGSVLAATSELRQDRLMKEFFEPLAWLVVQVERYYVEDVDRDRLLLGASQGILSSLDEYCYYVPPEMLADMVRPGDADVGDPGLQVRYLPLARAVLVEGSIPGFPAFREGILPGDVIVQIGEADAEEPADTEEFETVYDVLRALEGEPGSRVTLTVIRGEDPVSEEMTFTREQITTDGVEAARLVEPAAKIGYLHLTYFSDGTAGELRRTIEELAQAGAEGLILDLRFNPGGSVDAALSASDLFLDGGAIASREGRASPRLILPAVEGDQFPEMALAVLVNPFTAGPAEIMAGALKDPGRAVLVGETTAGRGGVQTGVSNPLDDSVIMLTTAHYFTPGDEPIEKEGIAPDVEVALEPPDRRRLARHLAAAIDGVDPPPPPAEEAEDAAEPFSDTQLERAIEALAGRMAADETPAAVDTAEPEPAGAATER